MLAADLDRTHYDTLGIDRAASPGDVKAAYRRLTKAHHPDRGGDADVFASINVAYETLRDSRAGYDRTLPTAGVSPAAWSEDGVVAEDDEWLEAVVATAPPLDLRRHTPPCTRGAQPPVYAPLASAWRGANAVRASWGALLVLASFACSLYGAGPAGVPWVVYVSFVVCFFGFLRACGLEWYGLAIEVVVGSLLVWGAYADDGTVGALAAVGVLAPIIVAGEMFAVRARQRERIRGRSTMDR